MTNLQEMLLRVLGNHPNSRPGRARVKSGSWRDNCDRGERAVWSVKP